MKTLKRTFVFVVIVCSFTEVMSAQERTINWLSFVQLEDSLVKQPKKVFIDFYADWCAYCKKMDRTAFKDLEVINTLNDNYYAVKMNAELQDSIVFGGRTFYNKELGTKRKPTHEIALLLASRPRQPFTLPAIVILNENFEVVNRYFEYLSPNQLKEILKN